MIEQRFMVICGEDEHTVGYSYSALSGKTKLCVDGDEFVVKGKPFKIGVCRREMIIIGSSQAILDVDKKGKAKIICRDADEIVEIK